MNTLHMTARLGDMERPFSPSIKLLLNLIALVSVCGPVFADDNLTTPPTLLGILAHDADPAFNAEPTTRTNATTVTVQLIGAEGWL
jgi:hypothetical protein